MFANAALGDLSAWRAAGVASVHSLPCTPGAADQAITAAAVEFVRECSDGTHPSLLALASADADFAGLVAWASAQPGLRTLVIGGFTSPRTGGEDGWRRRARLAGVAHAAVHWREVVARSEGEAAATTAATRPTHPDSILIV